VVQAAPSITGGRPATGRGRRRPLLALFRAQRRRFPHALRELERAAARVDCELCRLEPATRVFLDAQGDCI
jgi:hypothetical protein